VSNANLDISALTAALAQFCGTTNHYLHWTRKYRYTDGVHYLAETANAYWLIDAVVSHQHTPSVRVETFQAWELKRNADESWTLWATDGNDKCIAMQPIEYSDFPLSTIKLFLTDRCLMLPGEY
jgi:hypothetical protein